MALALNGVPIDVLAEPLNTTRGALYKCCTTRGESCRSDLAERASRSTRASRERPWQAHRRQRSQAAARARRPGAALRRVLRQDRRIRRARAAGADADALIPACAPTSRAARPVRGLRQPARARTGRPRSVRRRGRRSVCIVVNRTGGSTSSNADRNRPAAGPGSNVEGAARRPGRAGLHAAENRIHCRADPVRPRQLRRSHDQLLAEVLGAQVQRPHSRQRAGRDAASSEGSRSWPGSLSSSSPASEGCWLAAWLSGNSFREPPAGRRLCRHSRCATSACCSARSACHFSLSAYSGSLDITA